MELLILSIRDVALLPQESYASLFPRRMERAQRFRREDDRLRCIGAGLLLHRVLGIGEEELRYTERGKPFSAAAAPCFNLSHSGDYVLLAADESGVGADIERLDPAHLRLAKEVYQSGERAWMEGDPLRRFFVLWTLKESVMKQCGLGLSLSPRSFSVLPLTEGEPIQLQGKTLYAGTRCFGEYCLSVCAEHPLAALNPKAVTAAELLR